MELGGSGGGVAGEDCDGGGDEALAISDEFAVAVEVHALVKEAEAGEE